MKTRHIVAVGDSTTEGVGDLPEGRGWAHRVAERAGPDVLFANLAVRGRRAAEIRAEQFDAAVALAPDLVLMTGGLNDLLRRRLDLDGVLADLGAFHAALPVLTFTLPDLTTVMPVARPVRGRLLAYNDGLRALGAQHGTTVVDIAAWPFGADPRVWAVDRLHPNPEGHRRLAGAAAEALGLGDANWSSGLSAAPPRSLPVLVGREAAWAVRFFAPWIGRRLTGRSSGDGHAAKRPDLTRIMGE